MLQRYTVATLRSQLLVASLEQSDGPPQDCNNSFIAALSSTALPNATLKIRLVWDWWCWEISRRQVWIALAWLLPCIKSVDLSVASVCYSQKKTCRGKCPNSNVCSCLPGSLSSSLRMAMLLQHLSNMSREQLSWWRHGGHEVIPKTPNPFMFGYMRCFSGSFGLKVLSGTSRKG